MMIKLHVFGPHFGLPDASPFCVKGLLLLKMAKVPFEVAPVKFGKAPKGKGPYLEDGPLLLGDSHFIMRHLENNYGADFSGGYGAADLAKGWAASRMMEERFYFLMGYERWMDDENFWKGPYQFFKDAPAPIRPLIARVIRKKVGKMHHLQGTGRHTDNERFDLGCGDLKAIETLLGNNRYFLGGRISAADASVFPAMLSSLTPELKSRLGDYVRTRPILMDYIARILSEYFPDYASVAFPTGSPNIKGS
jgi:glutathione S-transferase